MNKKGSAFENVGKLGIAIVSLAVVLIIGFLIITQGKQQIQEIEGYTNDSIAYNATEKTAEGLAGIPGWIPIIVITAIGTILIGMVALFKKGR